jgi:hypothetical protein
MIMNGIDLLNSGGQRGVEASLILMDNHNIHQFSVNRVGQYDLHCLILLSPGRGSVDQRG